MNAENGGDSADARAEIMRPLLQDLNGLQEMMTEFLGDPAIDLLPRRAVGYFRDLLDKVISENLKRMEIRAMTADDAPPRFESCIDDGPFDEFAFATDGHYDPSRALLLALARAVACEGGYGPAETVEYLATVKWHKGFSGEHPTKYDFMPCDEDGICQTDCDDEGNEITLRNVKPTTWAVMKCDPPTRSLRTHSDRDAE